MRNCNVKVALTRGVVRLRSNGVTIRSRRNGKALFVIRVPRV